MKLIRIELQNFRAFYGDQAIDFSTNPDKPVTVIHGENGAGKTNLLNAIYWCLTGEFTPRLSNPNMLLNKVAREEDHGIEGFVEIIFEHDGNEYRARRTVPLNLSNSKFDVIKIVKGASTAPIAYPQNFIMKVIPKGLSKWFFFDAEAIGELSLSGGSAFQQSLRRTLGFELVDKLAKDLISALDKKQRAHAQLVKSKDLQNIQMEIDNKERVLPPQRNNLLQCESKLAEYEIDLNRINRELTNSPNTKELHVRRERLEATNKRRQYDKSNIQINLAKFNGLAIPSVLINEQASAFENKLTLQEESGRLPAPYSDQLVKDILKDKKCVCGREVLPNTNEEVNINSLLKSASTSEFNSRVKKIQYLLNVIQANTSIYIDESTRLREQIIKIDSEIATNDEELESINADLGEIDEEAVIDLEAARDLAKREIRDLERRIGVLNSDISRNEDALKNLRIKFTNESKKIGMGENVKKELDKIKTISDYMSKTLAAQEHNALNILQIELNTILSKYLTKHYLARINPDTYEVKMLDDKNREVGKSTGEEQVLKFAFISTVLALAGKKTKEKIDFMAEPIMAPLVLDAPFSALDPEYQSSVARNLAAQTSQLVLLLSSAAWGPAVSKALDPYVGKRYVIVSKQAGPQDQKPLSKMTLGNQEILLNEYDAERDESVIMEIN